MTEGCQLTIGMDARAAAEVPAGRGRVVRELLRALAHTANPDHRYVLYARERWEHPLDERFRWHLMPATDPLWHLLAARAANRECEVFFSTNSYLTSLFLKVPSVTMVHDLITFDPSMRPNRRSTVIERLTLGLAVRRSHTLLTTSTATTEALLARFPRARRTVLAPLGVRVPPERGLDADASAKMPAPGFVLAVGTLEPRKNLPRLVDAYASLERDLQRRHPLVVVGALGWETGQTLAALQALGDRCAMLGYVSDDALAELYRRCAVFCYPSLGEGFGLPVLEALAAGTAVVSSDVSSLPEVGGAAVEYVDPRDTASIAAGLRRLLVDGQRRTELAAKARARAREFSWDRFAGLTIEALQEAAGDRPAPRKAVDRVRDHRPPRE